jgi:AMP-polyphosphate phosphotransferase
VPQAGEIAVFDRSWYGRVLVERVEGFAEEIAWRRAYDEIAAFETALVEEGFRIVKLFLDITPETQLERFEERRSDPTKRWKITADDLRNRARWHDYQEAYAEAIDRTSLDRAPWHRVDMNDKRSGRIACFELILAELGRGVDLTPPELPAEVESYFAK